MWIYAVTIGDLRHDAAHIGWCLSGAGAGENDPAMERIPNVGPLPRGFYRMELIRDEQGLPCDHTTTEGHCLIAPVIRLVPEPETKTYGRDGFLMHGGTISHGCIVADKPTRQQVAASDDTDLQVVS